MGGGGGYGDMSYMEGEEDDDSMGEEYEEDAGSTSLEGSERGGSEDNYWHEIGEELMRQEEGAAKANKALKDAQVGGSVRKANQCGVQGLRFKV